MFNPFAKKNPSVQPAKALYKKCFIQARDPHFYEVLGVPDTLDGRFDLLLLHEFLVMNRLGVSENEGPDELSQALFDVSFIDIEQSLRAVGVGDMGIPKRMRKMMLAFNGRMHAYNDAVGGKASKKKLRAAVERNIYPTLEKPLARQVDGVCAYITAQIAYLATQDETKIRKGKIRFEASAITNNKKRKAA